MHAPKVSLLVVPIVVVIAGCSGLNAPTQPTEPQQVSQGPESLYVATSKPGLLTFQIQRGGGLTAVTTSASVPDTVCSAALSPAPGKIYSLSQLCPYSSDPMELRRFDLGPSGDIISGAGPFSLGPDLPSDTGHIFSFITASQGNFAYAWSFGSGREYITPIRIDASDSMIPMPGLGISWPLQDGVTTECVETHSPVRVTTTPEGMFLMVTDGRFCPDNQPPKASCLIFKLDSQTGAIEGLIGEAKLDNPPNPGILLTAQHGALMVLGEIPEPPATGNLLLFRVGADGVNLLQQCQADQPACAHALAAAFHPSGRWLFVSDNATAGIWTIPVVHGSLVPARASFVSMHGRGYKFVFSSDGKSLYIGQWVDDKVSGQISGFRVDDRTGALSEMPGSPWDLGTEFFINSMVHVAATGK